MFGLKAFFAGLARLTAAVNRSADLFETANDQLERHFGTENEPTAAAAAVAVENNHPANGSLPSARRVGRKASIVE